MDEFHKLSIMDLGHDNLTCGKAVSRKGGRGRFGANTTAYNQALNFANQSIGSESLPYNFT
jgi:hypothetical protein